MKYLKKSILTQERARQKIMFVKEKFYQKMIKCYYKFIKKKF